MTRVKKAAAKPPSARQPSYLGFDKNAYAWRPDIDYREKPHLYRVGRGEQGVLICEPYKSELVAHWRFATPAAAKASSEKIARMFKSYMRKKDFVGADMARKFLQMGFTRARRYANYKGGRKYDAAQGHKQLPRGTGDPLKAKSAEIFYKAWKAAEADPKYAAAKKQWRESYG